MEEDNALKKGEVIRIKCSLGFPPQGTYRVELITDGSVLLSAGEVQSVAALRELQLIERNLVGPIDWLACEIEVLEGMAAFCGCDECHQKLDAKRAQRCGVIALKDDNKK